MSLTIRRVALRNFRSYNACELNDIGLLTILLGPNAVGKTSLVEALRLLTAQRPLHHAIGDQLIRSGSVGASVEADVCDNTRNLTLGLSITEGKKRYTINGKTKHTSDLKGLIPSVSFIPEDLELARGSMSYRRQTLDAVGEQLSANHYHIRKDYEKLLRHKNHLLKENPQTLLIDTVDEMMTTVGTQLTCYRLALFRKLMSYMADFYSLITDGCEVLEGSYRPSWSDNPVTCGFIPEFTKEQARESFSTALIKRRKDELLKGRSIVGPHTDSLDFFIDGMRVSDFASQGQKRSVVLSFKLAEVALIKEISKQQPILLLDDVMSELDDARRRALVSFLSEETQTFITTAHLDYFDKETLQNARIIELGKTDGFTTIAQDEYGRVFSE